MIILLISILFSGPVFACGEQCQILQKGETRHVLRMFARGVQVGALTESCNHVRALPVPQAPDEESQKIYQKKWIHGSADCSNPEALEPKFDLLEVNPGYFIIRQNKCITAEAPFLYLMIGENGAFLHDTGDSHDAADFPLRAIVDEILAKKEKETGRTIHLTVGHGHSHGDHIQGDHFFEDRPNTTVVGLDQKAISEAYGIEDWPNGTGEIDLGGRKLSVIPIPGHEANSVAFYDHQSKDLLTGDSLYPGNIFLSSSNWPTFRTSIDRLKEFTDLNPVRNILGSHVEMTNQPGVDYPYGSRYQPDEHPLPLTPGHLNELQQVLQSEPTSVRRDQFSIPL